MKKAKGKCRMPHCKNDVAKNRTVCAKCRSREYKKRNPVGYYFNLLRGNARHRNKEFTLTLGEFKKFCEETSYLELKGKKGNNMSIDRRDHKKGYSYDNIRMITLSENGRKGYAEGNNVPF